MILALLIVGAFLAGSVPFGLLIARAKGIDLRKHGSGNIGATNAGRALGGRWFVIVLLLDAAKGFAPVCIAGHMLGTWGRLAIEPADAWVWLAVLLAAVLGHVFCPWLGFRGGKGVATSAGALLGMWPALTIPAAGAIVLFSIILRTTRLMSLASMIGAASASAFVALWFHAAHARWVHIDPAPIEVRHMLPFLTLALALGALVVWTHRANIARLRAGTEPRFGAPKPPPPQAPAGGAGS